MDRVLKQTLTAIENGKRNIFDIAESTRAEYEQVKNELNGIYEEVKAIIEQVDNQAKEELRARIRLAEVSRDFKKYGELDIKSAYEEAQRAQLKLAELRSQEKLLRYRRDHLEINLRRLGAMQEKAEKMLTQLGTVLNYLAGDLQDLGSKIGELEQIHQLGLSIMRAQEEERRRVAREIHDGPAQAMANIVMRTEYLQAIMDVEPARVKEELKSLQQQVRQGLADVRQIIFDLRPMVLDDLGLIPAIKRYQTEFQNRYNLPVELLVLGGQQRLPAAVEVALFRIFQESLSNIHKHSRARHVLVKLETLPKKINLVIKDDGCGFNPEAAAENQEEHGYGLVGMRERIQILQGELTISSAPGKGTTISVSVPV
ncbi:histidine kinase [Desulfotomaculum copahuensis]|uniref:Oxygen sensor histidine kinase NreB n=1 Tax=Desulfotomaculum copahuensis TaxID=1838280 RepID=A0A1B7LAY0_9FIRM|nr:histidine kinase [Desulfotomaculum copahuensis]